MGNFFKDNSYNIIKLFLNQIGITVFGTMLALATSNNSSLLLASSIFSTAFLLVLDYNVCWEIGAKDKIRIDGGRFKPMPAKGAVLSVLANIPNLLLSVLMGIGVLIGTAAAETVSVVCNAIARLLNGMYLGIIKALEYTIYTAPKLESAAEILISSGTAKNEISEVLTIIAGAEAGSSVEPIRKAMESLESIIPVSTEAAQAYTVLESAYYSPGLADIWWWFALITIPAILVCFAAYLLGSQNKRLLGNLSKKRLTK